MARTGARSVCRSVARVPFFGGGGRFGRSWGMRQSLGAPVPTRLCWGARRARAVLAVAPSNAMRAACDELAVPLLIVAMKTYRKHVLGRAMVPRLWRMGGAKGCTQMGCCSNFFMLALCRGPQAVWRSLCDGFCRRVRSKVSLAACKTLEAPSRPFSLCGAALWFLVARSNQFTVA